VNGVTSGVFQRGIVMIDVDAGFDTEGVDPQAEAVAPVADTEDLATRAADQATDLYSDSEHEQRRDRFDRAIRLAREH
jgi:hypothetical protein